MRQVYRLDVAHARAARPRNGRPSPGGYVYRGSGADTITPDFSDEEAAEALGDLVSAVAVLFTACEGCREPSGHTTDCPVEPGTLRPHGTPGAISRHYRRGEELCGRCTDGLTVIAAKARTRRREKAIRSVSGMRRRARRMAPRKEAA